MMNEQLDQLIDLALADGILTDNEKKVLYKKATELGIDQAEIEMVLDAKLHLKQTEAKPKSNKEGDLKKCPSCGSPVQSFNAKCNECGHEFRNVEVNSSMNLLLKELKKIRKSKFEDDEDEYFEARAEIIRDFAIPTSLEDLIEFASKGIAAFNSNETDNEEPNSEWASKSEEAITKLKIFYISDKSIITIVENLEKKLAQ